MSVVNFPEQYVQIWVCDCGCSSFSLRSDGEAECCNCGEIVVGAGGAWMGKIEDGPQRDENASAPFADVQGNGSVEFARYRISRLATESDVRALAVAKEDGSVSCWSAAETDDQTEWARRKFREAADLVGRSDGR